MLNEALGFFEWVKLNEEVEANVEVYTMFKSTASRNPNLILSYKKTAPAFQNMIRSVKPRLERVFKKYLPEFDIQHVGNNQYSLKYVVTNSEFKDDEGNDLELDFDSINPARILSSENDLDLYSAIRSISKNEISSGPDFVEVSLKPEFKNVPEEKLESFVFERFKKTWLGSIDPNEFSQELSSIVFSKSVGGSFFNENELTSFMNNLLFYELLEMYIEALSEEFTVTREEIDVNRLNSELDETFGRFVEKIRNNDLTDDDAMELIAFIKRLTFKLRTKGSEIREKAETIIAEIMTEINKAGLTRKLMDAL